MHKSNLTHIKQGTRKANWKIRGKLRAITGEDPAHAFMAAMTEDLEEAGGEDEKKAAEGFKTLMAAFPDNWRRLCPLISCPTRSFFFLFLIDNSLIVKDICFVLT